MKKISALFWMLLAVSVAFSQVDVGKAKNTIMGKGKLVATPFDEILFDNFSLTFNLYKFAEDQGGSSNVALSSKVGVRARLGGVDEALAQEIADEAYAYFVSSWEKRGKKLSFASKGDVESSKPFSKAKSKGKLANFINGGVWENKGKKVHQMTVWPSDVQIPQAGEGMNYKSGNAAFVANYLDMKYTSFNASIDFISFKTAKLGSTASVTSKPRLTMTGGLGATVWKKNKVGGYIGSIQTDGIEDYYSEANDESMEALGSKVVDRVYQADRDKFKSNVLDMIRQSMDASFADYDAVVAKNQ